jgi:hypothetical protein
MHRARTGKLVADALFEHGDQLIARVWPGRAVEGVIAPEIVEASQPQLPSSKP